MLLNIDIITYHSNLYWSYRNDIATMLVPRTMLWSISIWGKKGSPFDNLSQMNNSKNTCKILYLCMFTHAMYESSGWPSCFLIFQRSNEFYVTRTIIGTLPIGINCLQILFNLQIMQSIGFLGPAFFLTQLSHVRTPAMAVLCMACSQV